MADQYSNEYKAGAQVIFILCIRLLILCRYSGKNFILVEIYGANDNFPLQIIMVMKNCIIKYINIIVEISSPLKIKLA